MEIELRPVVSFLPETFNVLVAPAEVMAGAINSHQELQRFLKSSSSAATTPHPQPTGSQLH